MNRGEVHWFQIFPLRLACHRSLIWSAIGRHGSFTPAPAMLPEPGIGGRWPEQPWWEVPGSSVRHGSRREHVSTPGPGAHPLGNPGPPPLALAAPVAVGTGVPRAPAVMAVPRSRPLSRRPQL